MNSVMLALPSKGAIAEPTLSFLQDCGLRVDKPNPRQYTGSIPALPGVDVLFQRVIDVAYKVAEGTAQLGVTGVDVVAEYGSGDLVVVHPDLRFGHCRLLVAVPEAWIDVDSIIDLAEVALDFREYRGRNLRVATTYPRNTRQYLHANGIHHFTIVQAEGAIEAAPTIGHADVIIDLVQTGTTLRENHLKPLQDGIIVESQACLVGHRPSLLGNPEVRDAARRMLEHIDAALEGKNYMQVTVNMRGTDPQEVARRIADNPLTRGLQGPTVAPIYGADAGWHTVTIIVASIRLLQAVEYLRSIGGVQASVTPVRYLFLERSPSDEALSRRLGL
ncbi:MAG TPA: ATP phosphoribosyltransferase [Candidatus Limnocylindrales bacterium]|nr:ATP phosphoribosyltransferase [Candidatus Limnocylindrales bacterium]